MIRITTILVNTCFRKQTYGQKFKHPCMNPQFKDLATPILTLPVTVLRELFNTVTREDDFHSILYPEECHDGYDR